MSELALPSTLAVVRRRPVRPKDAFACLLAMRLAGLHSSFWPADADELATMSRVWAETLNDRGVLPETMPVAARRVRASGQRYMPNAGEFADVCERVRAELTMTVGGPPDSEGRVPVLEVWARAPKALEAAE